MKAKDFMVRDVITVRSDEIVSDALQRMQDKRVRSLPVVDAEQMLLGEFSTYQALLDVMPGYVASGDINHIEFVPDLGILQVKYDKMLSLPMVEAMNASPLVVGEDESVFSIAVELLNAKRSSIAIVVNREKKLQGVIARSDILELLRHHKVSL